MFTWLLIAAFLPGVGFSAFAQDAENPNLTRHRIGLSFGMQRSAERDAAYSPLVFAGTVPAIGAHYLRRGAKSTDQIHLSFAVGELNNRFGAGMRLFHAGLITYKFYHRRDPEKPLQFGWTNQNMVSVRTFADANNFNPRADVHTTFGPALHYHYVPGLLKQRLRFEVQGHLQVIGFLIASDYVSPFPAGFTDRSRSGVSALWHSARLLYPGAVWHWGLWPQVSYRLDNGNALGFSYRYDMVLLRGAHHSAGSRGQYLFSLNMAL
jgi:hypothetical protein